MLKRILEWSLGKITLREIRRRRRESYEHARKMAIFFSCSALLRDRR